MLRKGKRAAPTKVPPSRTKKGCSNSRVRIEMYVHSQKYNYITLDHVTLQAAPKGASDKLTELFLQYKDDDSDGIGPEGNSAVL